MSLNSINTNIAAMSAQGNIGLASSKASTAIAQLSSGNRLVSAATDVAALSTGTSLRTAVTTLRRALINTSQGSSLLQVADGALSQVTDILQRQKAIAVQASSGALGASERGFLNQEFQNLTKEIDRLASQTNFNGVSLLNGGLSDTVAVKETSTLSDKASASITFSANIVAAKALVLNGTTVTEGTTFTKGADIGSTLDNMVTALNSSSDAGLSKATYARNGNSLVITAKAGGSIGETYKINSDLATSTMLSATGAGTGARIGVISGQYDRQVVATVSGINLASTSVDSTGGAVDSLAAGAITGSGNANTSVTLATVVAGDSLAAVVGRVNANTGTTGVSAQIGGYSGNYSLIFTRAYNAASEGTSTLAPTGAALAGASLVTSTDALDSVAALNGGTDTGLGYGRNSVSGTVGNDLVTGLAQSKAKVTIAFPDIANGDLLTSANFGTTRTVQISDGVQAIKFGFVNQAPTSPNEVQIGTTEKDTLDNLAAAINNYKGYGDVNYTFDQFSARREGNSVILERNDVGNVLNKTGTAATVTVSGPTGTSTLGTFGNGSQTGGVDVSGVTNADFTGQVSGFKATFTGTNDTANLTLTVGKNTYTASAVDTTPTSSTNLVRFTSQDGGGFFDVYLGQNKGTAVNSQADANTFADRMSAAFSSLNFSQNRNVSSYQGNAPIVTNGTVTGSLIGTSVDLKTTDFSNVKIDSIKVLAPSGSNLNGSISISVNGETFQTAADVGSKLGKNSTFTLTSTQDANKSITFHTGDTGIDFSTKDKADAFQSALKTAFGVGNGSGNLLFQVGTTTSDTLSVAIGNVSTDTLFQGNQIDVLTQTNALAASDALDSAIKTVTSVRADVGALQSRFDFASANIQSSIQNQDAARGSLLDTDVAATATEYATAQVQLQAGIAVLAQANQLPQNLLKLIG